MTWRLLVGDVRERLRELPAESIQTCVTSPPYWGLRDYGVSGQIGLESTPEQYVAVLVEVFREVRRVLRDDGTLWINLGDSYSSQGGLTAAHGVNAQCGNTLAQLVPRSQSGPRNMNNLAPKNLIGIPWRVAFALQADGWYLRSDIIWSKSNPMPESVTDRPTKAHEYIFLLSKSARYYYDAEAIAESVVRTWDASNGGNLSPKELHKANGGMRERGGEYPVCDGTRNKRSVWHIATRSYSEAHFATYPEALIEPCVLAGSKPGDTVLDPFNGSGTTGVVAIRHQRHYIGIELNPEYIELARKRIGAVAPLFANGEVA